MREPCCWRRFASLAQFVSGDFTAKNVARHQPAKLAAMEGLFATQPAAPLTLLGWPDQQQRELMYELSVPGLLSWLLHGDTAKEVAGLDDLGSGWGTPPVWVTFQAYHLMVAIGVLFILSTLYASWLRVRGKLFEKRWLLWYFVVAVVPAFIANELGWVTAEVGRQPWIVYPAMVDGQPVGGLRTSEALSEVVRSEQVLGSILMFALLYGVLFLLWIIILNHKIQAGPEPAGDVHHHGGESAARGRGTTRRSSRIADGSERDVGRGRTMDLQVIWFVLLGVLLVGYAILDGFDFGVGILHFLGRNDTERRVLINSIGPLWDGNEVWLVTFGGALFAAFPEAYATVFSGFYVAFMLVLLSLILRAVSLEFRSKMNSPVWRRFWDVCFSGPVCWHRCCLASR